MDCLQGPGTAPPPPDLLAEAVDSNLSYTTGGNANWSRQTSTYYSGNDAAESGNIGDSQSTRMETTIQGEGTLTFYWKVSSESGYDYLEFWLDGVRRHRISGAVDWEQKSYTITGSGPHTLKWQYIKDSSADDGSDCGWVDYVQWSGSATPVYTPIPDSWDTVTYTYDADGRRIAKAFDGQTCLRYVYDGHDCIAEYDGNNNLLRKYIYGPAIDQPISMIDVKNGNATWYYHFDALGSVVALSDANGDTAEVYEYSVYGQVAASDPNHMNLFMFTGREFDKETGLYHYRARYYNPEIGRFIQTDPVGYQAGMHLYRYCKNNPVNLVDPFGRDPCGCDDANDGNDYNSPGSAGNAAATASARSSSGDRREDTCWGICDRCLKKFPGAITNCYACCNDNSPADSSPESNRWGVQCVVSALPDVFSVPGIQPIPGYRYGINKKGSPALSLIALLSIVLVRMCPCRVLLERKKSPLRHGS